MKLHFYRVVTEAGEYFLKMPKIYFGQFLETMGDSTLEWEEISELPPGAKLAV